MAQGILSREFYQRGTIQVAQTLLGKELVRIRGGFRMVGRIVEVEAYRGNDDPASHAYGGLTERNAPMYGEPGHAYVYFTYGNHYCLNVTTKNRGVPGAVLIRAIEPVRGTDKMRKFRPITNDFQLTNGPGKLTKAMNIDKSLNNIDLTILGPLFIERQDPTLKLKIARSKRIGISRGVNRKWRFYVSDNPYLSRRTF